MTLITRRSILIAGTATAGALLVPTDTAVAAPTTTKGTGGRISVGAGETYEVAQTTRVSMLSVAEGGAIVAPDGHALTLTVDGVESGQLLAETGGTVTLIQAGTYRGDLVLTVAEANDVTYETLTFPFRQALYVDGDGVVRDKSVLAAVRGGRLTDAVARGVSITSTGECFDGVYVQDGTYRLERPTISLTGNGRCDFAGYGAAVVGDGPATTLVLDGARISTKGVVRTAVIANDGANVLVKNSRLHTRNGVLPADYQATVETPHMQSVPWMLGLDGNVRATNLIGQNSKATYLNSTVFSQTWGALSVEGGSGLELTAINSHIGNTGEYGYGTYAIGDATVRVLGSRLDVGSYATICAGPAATVHYGDSTRKKLAALNAKLELGLTDAELAATPVRSTVVNSGHFGYMFFGAGTLTLDGGTVVNSERATFLNKGQQTAITVDGSRGARLNPRDGIILQMIELDDPGPVNVDGKMMNTGVYTEPTDDPTKDPSFDVTTAHTTDGAATFTSIALKGDFHNGVRTGRNMVLTFEDATVEGVLTASRARHRVATIDSSNFQELGIVTNTPQPAVNNGVIVRLNSGSTWTVTGTSYLTSLTLAADATLRAPHGTSVTMTVDATATAIEPGRTYTGAITLAVVRDQ
ncbi:hypothetical protein ADK57_13495 [Streptomyces sp. MMG1533]|uniref:hypothetical protein n=1 Tax=Streptomyces sp. MMG1533 TaxID=1415546 RepID=UPI0006AE5955|nr:hypothetical protein [Streptomyces sp. MMG1533]KOU69052.1 hypothetical protein ADK57_13495 [Streptomyces sp. MMG1533]